jgi:putative ABC transport system permease protein
MISGTPRLFRAAGRATPHVVVGLTIGLPVAWGISRGFGALCLGVQSSDLSIYLIVAAILLSAGLLARLLPARRAARVDPVISLRAS